VREIRKLLSEWLGVSEVQVETRRTAGPNASADLVIKAGSSRLVIEFKGAGDAASVTRAVEQVTGYAKALGRGAIPVVAVGFMGDVGRRICERAGVSWLDLSGNARIVAPGLRIVLSGNPNRFKRPGRPSTVFAPKSSRVVRQLLLEPDRSYNQRELARLTRIDEGFVSRIVRRLVADRHLDRDGDGAVRVVDPDVLLDAWLEAYDFSKHTIQAGHVSTRTSEELVRKLSGEFSRRNMGYALTGLGAAWALTEHAGYRLVTFFVAEEPADEVLAEVGFRDEPRGANVWLVVPNDVGVFDGAEDRGGVQVVHPVQAYLDLKGQPERAREAGEDLRNKLLRSSAGKRPMRASAR
jgi:hypothetical protein